MHNQPPSSVRIVLPVFMLAVLYAGSTHGAGTPVRARMCHAIVVNINDSQIVQSDLQDMATFLFKQRYGEKPPTFTSKEYQRINNLYREMAIRELIKMELIRDEARELEISVEVSEVDRKLRHMRLRKVKGSRMARDMAESELLFDRIMARMGIPSYRPSPREIRDFYAKSRDAFKENCMVIVRSIFLALDDSEDDSLVRRKADLLRRKVISKPRAERSAFFAGIAREFSEDAFKSGGGLIRISPDPQGWFMQDIQNPQRGGRNIFPIAMCRAIKNLTRKNDVSPVIKSERGYHILFLENIKGGRTLPFNDAVPVITRYLEQKERRKRMRKWIRDKWQRTDVKWHDGEPYPLEDILASLQDSKKNGKK